MKKRQSTIWVALSTLILVAGAAAEPSVTAKLAGHEAHWLLIQTAQHADFTGDSLRLVSVNPQAVMFSDRPQRVADTIPTARLVALWTGKGSSFQKVPPNAGVTAIANGKLVTATVELSQPRLNGTTLSYHVHVLEGTLPASSSTISVFIDNFCASCSDGGF